VRVSLSKTYPPSPELSPLQGGEGAKRLPYISWEQFLRHEQQLDDNRTGHDDDRRGVRREGAALLQGIVLCVYCLSRKCTLG
jgi:hypothetical protein